jgi:DNA ligase 1
MQHQKLRISMGEKSILAALALACLPPEEVDANVRKAWTEAVGTAYSQLPDYNALAAILWDLLSTEDDVAVRTQRLLSVAAPRVGVPVLTMAAYPIASVHEAIERLRKSGETRATCEFKYDGARVQLHLAREGIRRVFSRNMEDQTDKYGSLLDVLERQLSGNVSSLVMEGEVVAIDRETHVLLPFQVLQTKATTEFGLFAFDLLSINGESLIDSPLLERRQRLHEVITPLAGFVEFVDHLDIDLSRPPEMEDDVETERQVREALEVSVTSGCEGLMVKTLTVNATYRAGARSFSWVKLKHDYLNDETEACSSTRPGKADPSKKTNNGSFLPDTLDLVPIAAFYGKGRRAGVFGSFLLASVDSATGNFEAIGKVGSGFSDAQLTQLSEEFRRDGGIMNEGSTEIPIGYVAATTAAQRPDAWLAPTQVWEIKATQLTLSPSYTAGSSQLNEGEEQARKRKGLALRFPRFVRLRPEKSPDQATDSAQIATLFLQQSELTSSQTETDE